MKALILLVCIALGLGYLAFDRHHKLESAEEESRVSGIAQNSPAVCTKRAADGYGERVY